MKVGRIDAQTPDSTALIIPSGSAHLLTLPAITMHFTETWAQLGPARMVRAMQIAAGAQAITVVVTVVRGEGATFLLPAVFVAMWLAAAQLFRYGFHTFRATEIALYRALGRLPEPKLAHRFC